MSNVLSVDGKEYVSAIAAGRHFEYSKDYMLLLIKQGKIDGRKVGNKWYVHIPSAEVFFKESKEKRSQRRREVSQARKVELKEYTKVRVAPKRRRVLVETLGVLMLAVAVGATGFAGTSPQVAVVSEGDTGFLEKIAVSLYDFISPSEVVETAAVTSIAQTQIETSPDAPIEAVSAHVGTTTYTSLVVAPDELFTATTIEEVKDSFSDSVEVSVDPENPETGIITPIFKNSKGEDYRFLMVPVKTETP